MRNTTILWHMMIISFCLIFQDCYSIKKSNPGFYTFSKKHTIIFMENQRHIIQIKNGEWYFDSLKLSRGVNQSVSRDMYVHSIGNEYIDITIASLDSTCKRIAEIGKDGRIYGYTNELSFGVHLEDFFWTVHNHWTNEGIYFDILIFDTFDQVWKLIEKDLFAEFGSEFNIPDLDIKILMEPNSQDEEVMASNFESNPEEY